MKFFKKLNKLIIENLLLVIYVSLNCMFYFGMYLKDEISDSIYDSSI